jgi:hypothetical protein
MNYFLVRRKMIIFDVNQISEEFYGRGCVNGKV